MQLTKHAIITYVLPFSVTYVVDEDVPISSSVPDERFTRNSSSSGDRLFLEGSSQALSMHLLESRPRFDLTFDPVNQVVFWSDSHTGYIGAEDSRTGRSLGFVANLSEVSPTVLLPVSKIA